MRDAAIGNGASVLDLSGTAKAGNRPGRKDADAGEGGAFESALGRVRSEGRERQEPRLDIKGAGKDLPLPVDENAAEIEMPEIGQDMPHVATGRTAERPAIDIRVTFGRRVAAQNETTQDDFPPQVMAGRLKEADDAHGAARAKRMTFTGKVADAAPVLARAGVKSAGDGDIKLPGDDIRLRDGEKTVKLRKEGERAAAAQPKKDTAVADKGSDDGQQLSVTTDALSLLQNAAAPAPQAAPAASAPQAVSTATGAPDQAKQDGPLPVVTEKQEPLAAAQLLAPLVAPRMQAAMPVRTDMPGKAAEPLSDAKMPSIPLGEADAVSTEAPDVQAARADEDRIFRFSRADGRGQTLDMKIGAAERNENPRSLPVENVTVLDSRRYLALSPNMSTIATALSGDREWTGAMQPGAALSNAATQASTGKVVNTLKIQIHPMTLGAVTATMRLAGDELTIDLQVETAAAYRQLNDDQRNLVESLRAQGFSVDQVTVTLVSAPDKADTAGLQGNGQQNAGTGQQSAQDGGASARRDDRHAAGQQQNQRRGEEPQNGDPAAAGGRPGHLYL